MRSQTTRLRTERRTRDTTRREASLSPTWHWLPKTADRRTQLPHATSLPATRSSCLCAIFLPLMAESLPPSKTQATLSPLPMRKGWSGRLCKQTEARKPKNHTDTKATASWDSWNHSQCKLGRKCSLPTKAAFLCRGAGVRGGQVCGSWGTWKESVRCQALARGGGGIYLIPLKAQRGLLQHWPIPRAHQAINQQLLNQESMTKQRQDRTPQYRAVQTH